MSFTNEEMFLARSYDAFRILYKYSDDEINYEIFKELMDEALEFCLKEKNLLNEHFGSDVNLTIFDTFYHNLKIKERVYRVRKYRMNMVFKWFANQEELCLLKIAQLIIDKKAIDIDEYNLEIKCLEKKIENSYNINDMILHYLSGAFLSLGMTTDLDFSEKTRYETFKNNADRVKEICIKNNIPNNFLNIDSYNIDNNNYAEFKLNNKIFYYNREYEKCIIIKYFINQEELCLLKIAQFILNNNNDDTYKLERKSLKKKIERLENGRM